MDGTITTSISIDQKEKDVNEQEPRITDDLNRISNHDIMSRLQLLEQLVLDNKDAVSATGMSSKEIDEDEKYPQDCYSLIALNGPKDGYWSAKEIRSFCFGLLVFVFQIVFFGLMIFSVVNPEKGTVDDPGNPWNSGTSFWAQFISPNVKYVVNATQIVALVAFVVFPDATLQGIVKGIQLFPPLSEGNSTSVFYLRFACILRLIQGIAATTTVWILVMTTKSVIDIILNFTAISFVSSLDEDAFSLAEDGVFGRGLQKGATRVTDAKLPAFVCKRSKHLWHWYWTVMAFAFILLFGFTAYIFFHQQDSYFWITRYLKVEFYVPAYQQYSGCFEIDSDLRSSRRFTYRSIDPEKNLSMGYCFDDRQWLLFDGDYDLSDPCSANPDNIHLKSSPTDSLDISTSLTEDWVSSSGVPILVAFYRSLKDEYLDALNCDESTGDGVCDVEFNTRDRWFDYGDCCAATCLGPECGRGGLTNAFDSNMSADGFPYCKDASLNLVSITIQLNGITSSRKFVDTTNWAFLQGSEAEWRNETPVETYFAIDCNNKSVFTVFVDQLMVNKSQSLILEDGSSCRLTVKNNTGIIDLANTWLNDPAYMRLEGSDQLTTEPIWYINYTIFHGGNLPGHEQVQILNQQTDKEGDMSFTLIPNCYIHELENYTNIEAIYDATSSSSNQAIGWLTEDLPDISQCGENSFIERYVLVAMNFAMSKAALFITREDHCRWPSITCSGHQVHGIALPSANLEGGIPSEIMLLGNLEKLDFRRFVENKVIFRFNLLHFS
jgi:hypothetical protein